MRFATPISGFLGQIGGCSPQPPAVAPASSLGRSHQASALLARRRASVPPAARASLPRTARRWQRRAAPIELAPCRGGQYQNSAGQKPLLGRNCKPLPLGLFLGLLGLPGLVSAGPAPSPQAQSAAYAQNNFRQAQTRCRQEPANPVAAWQFGRACFDLAECATNQAERAQIAEQGIAACRQALARASNSAPAHYYLGVNLGQLARTRGLSALKLVGPMRHEFDLARSLDEHLDQAGPDRNLGQLYRDAPALASIGSRSQAQRHLQRAVTLAPHFPDNRLELIEAYLKWGQRDQARRELKTLEEIWPAARAQWTGPAWAASWADWEEQLEKFRKKIERFHQTLAAPSNKK